MNLLLILLFSLPGSLAVVAASGLSLFSVIYELSTRDSSAAPYSYDDHRILLKARWSFAADPWLPRAADPVGHVPLDYHLDDAEAGERVQDLLRQNEGTQRSSSCRE